MADLRPVIEPIIYRHCGDSEFAEFLIYDLCARLDAHVRARVESETEASRAYIEAVRKGVKAMGITPSWWLIAEGELVRDAVRPFGSGRS